MEDSDVRWAGTILSCLAGFAILLKVVNSTFELHSDTSKTARSLTQTALTWRSAAEQDEDAVFSLVHSTFALAYLHAARRLAADDTIARLTAVQPHELVGSLEILQNRNLRSIQREMER